MSVCQPHSLNSSHSLSPIFCKKYNLNIHEGQSQGQGKIAVASAWQKGYTSAVIHLSDGEQKREKKKMQIGFEIAF